MTKVYVVIDYIDGIIFGIYTNKAAAEKHFNDIKGFYDPLITEEIHLKDTYEPEEDYDE